MNNIGVKNFITFPVLQTMDQCNCLIELFAVNKAICCAIIKYINRTRIQLLQEKQIVLISNTSLVSKKIKHLPFLIGDNFFFDLHWSGLLLYAAACNSPSYEERRGKCIAKIVQQLRTRGFRAQYALTLIKTILSFGQISPYQQTNAFAYNITQIHPLHQAICVSSVHEREIALVLLQSGSIQKNIGFFLAFAVEKNDVEMVQIFLRVVPEIASNHINEAYDKAVAINNEQMITILSPYVKKDQSQPQSECVIA